MLPGAEGNTVVEYSAVIRQHDSVTAATLRQIRNIVREEHVEKPAGVRPPRRRTCPGASRHTHRPRCGRPAASRFMAVCMVSPGSGK